MQQRRRATQFELVRLGKLIGANFRIRWLKRPRGVVDLAAEKLAPGVGCIEAIALRQPMLQTAWFCLIAISGGTVSRVKFQIGGASSPGVVMNLLAVGRGLDSCPIIRQVKRGLGDHHGQWIGGIEAQEPDAGFSLMLDIDPQIELRKSRNPGIPGNPRSITSSIRKGTTPTQDVPSNSCTSNAG